jgi:GxxExxY protein
MWSLACRLGNGENSRVGLSLSTEPANERYRTGTIRLQLGGLVDDATATAIVESALRVHTALGPGLLESAYEACLIYELEKRNIPTRRQVAIPVTYEDVRLDAGFRLDLVVDERMVVEVKSCKALLPIHIAQVLTYLRLGRYRIGYLLNFNVAHMRDGIRRVING